MKFIYAKPCIGVAMLLFTALRGQAQNDVDAIMMGKNLFCAGVMSGQSSWNKYWEGTNLRINENIGTLRTTMVGPMGSLGVTKNLNLIFSLPYVQTKASAGQLKGLNGIQDFSLWGKYRVYRKKTERSSLSFFTIGGFNLPTHNYTKDLLPLSIGLGSRNLILRGMADYEYRHMFATVSSSYILRSNIQLDRQAYYTTHMVYSNKVAMPNVLYNNIRLGFRNKEIVAEVVADQWLTKGGFDITKNNMPFPSNRMEQTRIGFNGKYEPVRWKGISLTGAFYHTVSGRNMGKANFYQFGFFYIFHLSPKTN
jgi:hypothetical protein